MYPLLISGKTISSTSSRPSMTIFWLVFMALVGAGSYFLFVKWNAGEAPVLVQAPVQIQEDKTSIRLPRQILEDTRLHLQHADQFLSQAQLDAQAVEDRLRQVGDFLDRNHYHGHTKRILDAENHNETIQHQTAKARQELFMVGNELAKLN